MYISIHLFTEAELEATDEVLKAAYKIPQSRKESLYRYLALQPDGAFVAKHNDTIIGFGGAIDYGPFAYIGLMAAHPSMQKRGVGGLILQHLLAWLDERRCPTILLDATPFGAPLYKRYGFIEDDTTIVLRSTERIALPHHLSEGISPLSEKDLPAVVAFDSPYFGADRGTLLASYWTDDPQRTFITRDSNGQITGYLFAQPGTLGPWIANTVEDAERLLMHALTLSFVSEPNVFVSARNNDALQLLNRYGFSQQRTLSHMRRGNQIQRSRHTMLYGQASLGFG
jgi:GNAT superfamily N-acetyltransferase